MTKGYHDSKTPESIRDLWRTPKALFDYYDLRFGFNMDVAASFENAILPHSHLGKQYNGDFIDALDMAQEWGSSSFVNPPYSDIFPWVKKAIQQMNVYKNLSVMLIPADTSVKWFKLAFENCTECHLISGRISFINEETGKPVNGNNKGSVVFIFDPNSPIKQAVSLIDRDEIMRVN